MKATVNNMTIHIVEGDILNQTTDAIVVVTDPNLSVESRLLRLAGNELAQETEMIGWCDVGKAVITSAGAIPHLSTIVHLVSPRWGEGNERARLSSAIWECLHLIEDKEIQSVTVPAISAGLFGYPIESSANITLTRIIDFTFESLEFLSCIVICLEDQMSFDVFRGEFERQLNDLRTSGEATVIN